MHKQPPSETATECPAANPNGQRQPPPSDNQPQDQRDPRGRFAAGNRGGPGNPFARQTAALRQALVNAVTPQDIADIAAGLRDKARQGDVSACKLLFSYALGKPTAAVDPDTLDQQELKNLAANHVGLDEVQRVINSFPVELMLTMIRAMLPHLETAKARMLGEQLGAPDRQHEPDDDTDGDADDTQAAPPTAEPASLEETRRACEEEVQQLKAQLHITPPRLGANGRPILNQSNPPTRKPVVPASSPGPKIATDRQQTARTASWTAPDVGRHQRLVAAVAGPSLPTRFSAVGEKLVARRAWVRLR
jgi:hypothetical protein